MKLAALQASQGDANVRWTYVDAGQHYDHELARQYLDEYRLKIDVQLECGSRVLTPTEVFARLIVACETAIAAANPDGVVVFGDANTTLAAALAARRLRVPLAHVEAGVRTGMDTPEELNRVLTDRMSQLHLASTKDDLATLETEGYGPTSVWVGDLVRDLCADVGLGEFDQDAPIGLVTLHRAEHTTDLRLLEGIVEDVLARGLEVHLLTHPRVMRMIDSVSGTEPWSSVKIRPSVPHRELLALLNASAVAVTDSGALQREAFYVGTRCVVVQERPFWKTLTDAGYNISVQPGGSIGTAIDAARCEFTGVVDDFGEPPVGDAMRSVLEEWAYGLTV